MKERLEVLFEDQDFVVVNKPAGLLSVPIRGGKVPSALSVLKNNMRGDKKGSPLVVHRIDRYTAGLLVFAKNPRSRHKLIQQFLRHTPIRRYEAVVHGVVDPAEGTLRHSLYLVKKGFRQMVVPKGKVVKDSALAVLRFRTKERLKDATLVEIELETGLKNQIRAQFAAIGHPVVGDIQYGEQSDKRNKIATIDHQALYASYLSFAHPRSGKKVEFQASVPKEIREVISKLRWQEKKTK